MTFTKIDKEEALRLIGFVRAVKPIVNHRRCGAQFDAGAGVAERSRADPGAAE